MLITPLKALHVCVHTVAMSHYVNGNVNVSHLTADTVLVLSSALEAQLYTSCVERNVHYKCMK